MTTQFRLGVDLGGTKIEAVVLDADNQLRVRRRVATPASDYPATVAAVATLVAAVESELGQSGLPVGICTPGTTLAASGLIKNANSTCLNGKPLHADLEQALERRLRLANDADCLAVSEAADGAAAGASSVFAVILGTGVGGGIVTEGRLQQGPNAVAGEWGHNPLPWPHVDELPGPDCWCALSGCMETWLSGPALAGDYFRRAGERVDAEEVAERAAAGHALAESCLVSYEHRLARGLASVINLLDPEVIVLGGGLSKLSRLYTAVPLIWGEFVFSDQVVTRLVPALHGDSSGVRGAAWLNTNA